LILLKSEHKSLNLEKKIEAHEEWYTKPWRRRKDRRSMKECKENGTNQRSRTWCYRQISV